MKNFVYHNPTKIIFGRNSLESLGPETAAYGTRVFLVYGRSTIKHHGILDKVLESLHRAGCEITQFSGVAPNPTLSKIEQGIDLFKTSGCQVVCGVGGGSVIDAAKAISCGVDVDHGVWKFFIGKKSVKSVRPLICVSTLAGSGSENNSGMVLTHEEKQLKCGFGSQLLRPKVSILDPELTFTVPAPQTAYGSIDILCHLIEIYLNNSLTAAPLQWNILEGLIKTVLQSCEIALRYPSNYDARSQLMWASALALSGFTSSGLGRIGLPIHLIEHALSACKNSSHGAGLAVLLPAWLTHRVTHQPEDIAQLGRNIFAIQETDPSLAAQMTAEKMREWIKAMGCPVTLQELGVEIDQLESMAENSRYLAKIWRIRDYPPSTVLEILESCCN